MTEKALLAIDVDGNRKVTIHLNGKVELLDGVTAKQALKYISDILINDYGNMLDNESDVPEYGIYLSIDRRNL